MPTLYVRNVPDDLYARLRARAQANGRPIGGEALQLLADQLPERARRRGRRKSPATPFARFGDPARAVIVNADEEAAARSHAYIGTEHLLLGVLAQSRIAGLDLDAAGDAIDRLVPAGDASARAAARPLTARAKRSLELAVQAAGVVPVAPGHIALGLVDEGGGIAAQVLAAAGIEREALLAALELESEALPFQVVALEGEAERWAATLNEAVVDADYELVGIVDGRAVLRRARA
jgi:hypothetical protein